MSQAVSEPSSEAVLQISNVWKIFGDKADEALKAIKEKGLTKSQVLETYNAVVGVADVSFDVKKGEIFLCHGFVWKWQIDISTSLSNRLIRANRR